MTKTTMSKATDVYFDMNLRDGAMVGKFSNLPVARVPDVLRALTGDTTTHDLLRAALSALNGQPRFATRGEYRDSYELAAAITKHLNEEK